MDALPLRTDHFLDPRREALAEPSNIVVGVELLGRILQAGDEPLPERLQALALAERVLLEVLAGPSPRDDFRRPEMQPERNSL